MNPLLCCVCTDPEDQNNKFFACKNCGVCIHALCYGIDIDVESLEDWLCSPCKSGIVEPSCILCVQTTGAMKKTTNNKWVHAICALFTEGAFFEDENNMEPVNLSSVSESKQNQTCAYCLKTVGFCSLCSKSKCAKRIHVTCAQRNKCTIEITKEKSNSIDFRAFCSEHKPRKSKRRVSSKFVRNVVAKKGQKAIKKKYVRSANQNASWILSMQDNVRDQSVVGSSSVAIPRKKFPLRVTGNDDDKENEWPNVANTIENEKVITENKSVAKSSERAGTSKQNTSKQRTSITVSGILKSIENKTINAEKQMNADETPLDISALETSSIASIEKNQTENTEGMFCNERMNRVI